MDIVTWVLGIAAYLSVMFRTVKQGIVEGTPAAALMPQCARHARHSLPASRRLKHISWHASGRLQAVVRYCLMFRSSLHVNLNLTQLLWIVRSTDGPLLC